MATLTIMNEALHPDDRRSVPRPRPLTLFLLSSAAVHVMMLIALPGWQRDALPMAPPVLDVVMRKVEPLYESEPPQPAETLRRIVNRPQPVLREPERTPATRVQAAEELPAPVSAPAESPPVPVAADASRAPPRDVLTSPVFNAAYLRNPPPRYPAAARRSGDQGTVMVKVLVSSAGDPLRVDLDQSSGSGALDGAALDAVKGWRFVPARRGDRSIADWVRVPIVFRLEG